MNRPFCIRIRYFAPSGYVTRFVSGYSLDDAKDEAIRWINNHPAIRKAEFEVVRNG